MKIENIEVYGWRAAIRGMRNPMDSWDRSDSYFNQAAIELGASGALPFHYGHISVPEHPILGVKDEELACKLIKGGSEHRKFLRQIQVWFDITIPRYVWQELDTYKVATVRNSCSTMHTLGVRDLTQDDFELPITVERLAELNEMGNHFRIAKQDKNTELMNSIRRIYKNALPEGFLQKATYTMNYETAMTMYFQRKGHRLPEWKIGEPGSITSFIYALPYMATFVEARTKGT